MKINAIGLSSLVLVAVLLVPTGCSAIMSYMGLYVDEAHLDCEVPVTTAYTTFTCWHWVLPGSDGTICAEYKINASTYCLTIGTTPNPGYSAAETSGYPSAGVSICMNECQTDWFWTYKMDILTTAGGIPGQITIEPHPDSGVYEPRTRSCADGNPIDISLVSNGLMLNQPCYIQRAPRLYDVDVISPTCLKAYFDACVYHMTYTYDGHFWLYETYTPVDSVKIAAVVKLPLDSEIYGSEFLIYLNSPMETGMTYTLAADVCCESNGCAFSTEDVTFEGGFTDSPDLAITYIMGNDGIAGEGYFNAWDSCGSFVRFNLKILNAGTIDAGSFSVAVSMRNSYVPGSEELVTTLSYNNLAAGQFINKSVFLSFPEGYLNRYISFIVKADCYHEVVEWTEADNEYTAHSIFEERSARIVSIKDVPDDYGGWVEMVFNPSPLDNSGMGDLYSILRLNKPAADWVKVAETEATGSSSYTIALPTTVDSSGNGESYQSVFRVIWEFPIYHDYFTSCPDSGYSINNLGTVAVLLEENSAFLVDSSIRVTWKIASAIRNEFSAASFLVSRAADGGPFTDAEINILGGGFGDFYFSDTDVEPGQTYRYRIECLDENDRTVLFETEAISIPAMPLTLDQNMPNPFNPSTVISFYLPEPMNVCIEIFDVSGRLVTVLENRMRTSGRHRIEWNGLDDSGSRCSSGVYFYRLKAGKEVISRKMVLMR